MPEKTEDTKKPNQLTKILLGLATLVAAGGGANAAGYTPDVDETVKTLQALGIVGAAALIIYLHYVWLPIVKSGKQEVNDKLDTVLKHVTPAQGPTEEVDVPALMQAKRAQTNPGLTVVRPTEGGSTTLSVLLAFVACGLVACSWLKSESKATGHDVVNCTTATVRSLDKQFGPVLDKMLVDATDNTGHVDWDAIKHASAGFAVDTGLCVMANTVERALVPIQKLVNAPKSEALELDPASLRAGFTELAGGRHFKTEHGEL